MDLSTEKMQTFSERYPDIESTQNVLYLKTRSPGGYLLEPEYAIDLHIRNCASYFPPDSTLIILLDKELADNKITVQGNNIFQSIHTPNVKLANRSCNTIFIASDVIYGIITFYSGIITTYSV
jgi:hypothetical protein